MNATDLIHEANLQDSHWGHRIIVSESFGKFTSESREEGSDWNTCPVGKSGAAMWIDANGDNRGPMDTNSLWELGCQFATAVCENEFVHAAEMLISIHNISVAENKRIPAQHKEQAL